MLKKKERINKMAKGVKIKEEITNKILETFPGSFKYDKEIRIPGNEDGEALQIKCVLTCAKTNVDLNNTNNEINFETTNIETLQPKELIQMTQEEMNNIANLAKSLGF